MAACHAAAQPWQSDAGVPSADFHGRLEVKRVNTSRGTPEETTRSSVRIENFIEGSLSLIRVDVPFPDAQSDFEGSPFDPRLGDIKVRAGFSPLVYGRMSFPSFVELTLPTANPESLGAGKYQLGLGLRMLTPFRIPQLDAAHATRFEAEVSQTASIGGDPARSDVNYTKLEFTLYDLWRDKYTLKLKLKPAFDYVRHAQGGTGEIEGGFYFGEQGRWRTWLMLGSRLYGDENVSGTYNTQLELGLARTF